MAGFRSYPDGQGDQSGSKRRLRPESFADHYNQAQQFFISQNEAEQRHIIDAFTFELSKCDRMAIRTRMVAGLRNVDEDLARSVAAGLGLPELPDELPPAREPVRDLAASPALSILANGSDSFAGRKLGILVTDGVDAAKLAELTSAAEQAKVNVELVAPAVGGVEASDGQRMRPARRSTAAPRCSTTRSSCSPPSRARHWRPCPRPETSWPTPSPIANSLVTQATPRRCSTRPG